MPTPVCGEDDNTRTSNTMFRNGIKIEYELNTDNACSAQRKEGLVMNQCMELQELIRAYSDHTLDGTEGWHR